MVIFSVMAVIMCLSVYHQEKIITGRIIAIIIVKDLYQR